MEKRRRLTRQSSSPRSWALSFYGKPVEFIGEVMGPEWWTQDWLAWRALTKAVFALPMDEEELAAYRECTNRPEPPSNRQQEVWVPIGRRGGKSRWAAMMGVYLACCEDNEKYIAPGERGFVLVLAADRSQAHQIMRYAKGILRHPKLAGLVERDLVETVELEGEISISVSTASIRAVRSRTVIAALCDELAFWEANEESANPDADIINSLSPGMLTIPNRMLIGSSSPYARKGVLWDKYKDWFGRDDGPLVWKASTVYMHPSVDRKEIDRKYQEDPAAAAAEYGAEFRSDVEVFVSREIVESAIIHNRFELPYQTGVSYGAFVDPSGGTIDSFTLAIAHRDPTSNHGVLDCLREAIPLFSPEGVVAEFAKLLHSYGIVSVEGDHYAGEWPREQFSKHGITYVLAEKTKSVIYQSWLPLLNSGRCDLLDHPRLVMQTCQLERRHRRGGRDTIDHQPRSHDDVANAAAGALVKVTPMMNSLEAFLNSSY